MWEAFGLRALPYSLYGGADLGECVTTVERIGDGTAADWYREMDFNSGSNPADRNGK